jgi:hypothetical protein
LTDLVEQRCKEPVERGKAELALRLYASKANDPEVVCPMDRVVQQCGLANARLTANNQDSTQATLDRANEFINLRALFCPTEKRHAHAGLRYSDPEPI